MRHAKKWQLQELLHFANETPLIPGVEKRLADVYPSRPTRTGSSKIVLLQTTTERGLPSWIPQLAMKAIFRKIRSMTAGNEPLLVWKEPLHVHTQMKMTLQDPQKKLEDPHRLQNVIFRALPTYQGTVAQDCVKVLIDDGVHADPSWYFAQCMAFIQDADNEYFVVVRWFEKIDNHAFELISHVPSFKLEPENMTDSYCILPADSILNGAMMFPGARHLYWVLLAPKEEERYARQFQQRNVQRK
jgi:hypothetical protein